MYWIRALTLHVLGLWVFGFSKGVWLAFRLYMYACFRVSPIYGLTTPCVFGTCMGLIFLFWDAFHVYRESMKSF